MEDKEKQILDAYFHKDEFGNYVISEFEDLGFDLDFEELNLFTKSLNIIGNHIEYLQKELSKTKKENEILTKNAEHNDKVVDKVNWKNMFLKDKLKKIEEYITSYESISTIQGLNDTKENKNYNDIMTVDGLGLHKCK